MNNEREREILRYNDRQTVSGHVEPAVSGEFKISKKEALRKMQGTFDKSISEGDLVGASVATGHMKAIASTNSC